MGMALIISGTIEPAIQSQGQPSYAAFPHTQPFPDYNLEAEEPEGKQAVPPPFLPFVNHKRVRQVK